MSGGNFSGGSFSGAVGGFSVDSSVIPDTHDDPGGWRKEERKDERKRVEEHKRSKEQLRTDLEQAWTAVTGHPEESVIKEAIAIAKPALPKRARSFARGRAIPSPQFDLLSEFKRQQLISLWRDLQEEEEILLWM